MIVLLLASYIPQTAGNHHQELGHLPCWPKAHSAAAMRLPREPGDTDDRVEGCLASDTLDVGHRSLHAALRPRLPSRPTRRSHRWTKDQLDSTFGRNTSPLKAPSIGIPAQYESLIFGCNIRKLNSTRGQRSYWKITYSKYLRYSSSMPSHRVCSFTLKHTLHSHEL